MANGSNAAWEWRGFWAADGSEDPLAAARQLAALLGVEPPHRSVAEDDLYLVAPSLRPSLKLRRGALELKVELRRFGGDLSLWADKRTWTFPLDRERAEQLWSAMDERWRFPGTVLRSMDELVWWVRQQDSKVKVVQVRKQRVRLKLPESRLEVASVLLPGEVRLLSYGVDGYNLGAVCDVVRKARLRSRALTLSYAELLRTPALDLGSVSRAVAA